jgi:hypothetical protein
MPWFATRLCTLASLLLCIMVVRFVAAVVAVKSDSPVGNLVGQPAVV